MATEVWLDPDAAAGGDGSESTPFDSWADITWALTDLTINVKRGTSEVLAIADWKSQSNQSGLVIRPYGDAGLPYHQLSCYDVSSSTGDWTDLTGNVWEWDSGDNTTFRTYIPIGYGSLGTVGPRLDHYAVIPGQTDRTLDEEGEWDAESGDGASDNCKFVVYSDANPVTKWTQVYISEVSRFAFGLFNATNADISGIHFSNCAAGFAFRGGTNSIIHHCQFTNCYFGARILAFTGDQPADTLRITQCEFNNMYQQGIGVTGPLAFTDCKVDHNTIYRSCEVEAFAPIYVSAHNRTGGEVGANETIVEFNNIDYTVFGEYYPSDGHGLHCSDIEGYDTIIRSNFARNVASVNNSSTSGTAANFHSNTGGSNHFRYSNVSIGGERGAKCDNSEAIASREVHIYNNNCRELGLAALTVSGDAGTDVSLINNLAHTEADAEDAIIVANATVDAFTTDDYNITRGYTTDRSRGTIGANSINSTTPEYDMDQDGRTKIGTAAIGAGSTSFVPAQDFDGRAYDAAAPNIGAFGGLFLAESPAGRVDCKPTHNLTRGCGQIRRAA